MLLPSLLLFFRGGQRISIPPVKPGRILLVKQSERLGNIVLMNAAISGLRQALPEARIDLLLPAAYAGVMRANPNINRVIPIAKREYIFKPWKLRPLLRELRMGFYNLAINCSDVNSHSSTEAAYTLVANSDRTCGWKIGRGGLFDLEVEPYSETVHASQMYVRLFSGIFKRPIEGEPFFPVDRGRESGNAVVGINCGGRGSKRVPLDRLLALGEKLAHSGARIEFILGPEEADMREGITARLPKGSRLLPPTSLEKLMAIISGYRAFVSSDTGPMHLAWSLGVPTVAIFLDSELEKFRPLAPGSLAVDGRSGFDLDGIGAHLLDILDSTRAQR